MTDTETTAPWLVLASELVTDPACARRLPDSLETGLAPTKSVYCSTDGRGALAAFLLMGTGHPRVAGLDGGLARRGVRSAHPSLGTLASGPMMTGHIRGCRDDDSCPTERDRLGGEV